MSPAGSAPAPADGERTVVPLGPETWELFAELVERNNGVYGGCWCIGYHPECGQVLRRDRLAHGAPRGCIGYHPECGQVPRSVHQEVKRARVMDDAAHAALVVDADGLCQAWAQYGPPDELAGIKHKREYLKEAPPTPDWRLTCVYVDPRHRGQGLAREAITGALGLIAAAGGGSVEAISETTDGRTAQGRFLFTATAELLEDLGFERVRQVSKHAWILTREVAPAS